MSSNCTSICHTAVRCAYADLQGVVEALEDSDPLSIDVDAIKCTLSELESAFGSVLCIDNEAFEDDIDGDAASALASAGFGTNEDYGGSDERY